MPAMATALIMAHAFPAGLIGTIDKLVSFANYFRPVVGATQGISQFIVQGTPVSFEEFEGAEAGDVEFEEKVSSAVANKAFGLGVQGMSTDAVMLMQKTDPDAGWSDWGDYDKYIPRLAEMLRATGRKLQVDMFYSESDLLIGDAGTKGPLWFDACWRTSGCEDVIQYWSTTVKGVDHDRAWNLRWRVPQRVFAKVATMGEDGLPGI